MHARLAGAIPTMGSKFSSSFSRARIMFSRLKKSEVAEALIATWCIEFLRVRKIGGFNVVEIVVISALMLGVKTIITEASRRRYSDQGKRFVMSTDVTPMEHVGDHGSTTYTHRRPRRTKRYFRFED